MNDLEAIMAENRALDDAMALSERFYSIVDAAAALSLIHISEPTRPY